MDAGEWLAYTVNVASAGVYGIEFRVSSAGPGGTFHLEVNGVDRTGPISIPDTGGMAVVDDRPEQRRGTWIGLAGLVIDSTGSSGAVGNLNYIRVSSGGGTVVSNPFGGNTVALPGVIETETTTPAVRASATAT